MRKRGRSESPDNHQQGPSQPHRAQGANLQVPNFITPERTIVEKLESIQHVLLSHSSIPGKQEILGIINRARVSLTAIIRENSIIHSDLRRLYDSNLQFLRIVDEIENRLQSCEQLVNHIAVLTAQEASTEIPTADERNIREVHIAQICLQLTCHADACLPLLDRAETLKDGIIYILDRNFEDSDDDNDEANAEGFESHDDSELKPLEARFMRWNNVMITAIKEIYRTQIALQQPKDDFGLRELAKTLRHDFKKLLQSFTGAMKKMERMHIKLLRYSGEAVDSPDPSPPGSPVGFPTSSSSSGFFSGISRSSSEPSESSDSSASAKNQKGKTM